MAKRPTPTQGPPDGPTAEPLTRAEVLLEAMLTEQERRKPGYTRRLLDLLITPPEDTSVTVLRPTSEPDPKAREAAIAWLREVSVRARARAASKRRSP